MENQPGVATPINFKMTAMAPPAIDKNAIKAQKIPTLTSTSSEKIINALNP